jgi:hypothetical protein
LPRGIERSYRATLERSTNTGAQGALDLIPKDVVAQAQVIPTPADDPRPREAVEKVAAAAAPFCPRDPTGDNADERSQKTLKRRPSPHTQDEMQMGADVGEVIDTHIEPTGHSAEDVAHDAIVPAQGPSTARSVARENHVHRPSRADGALELATAAMDFTAVLRPRELGMHFTIEKGQLHRL